jgi:hypothetical protein
VWHRFTHPQQDYLAIFGRPQYATSQILLVAVPK